MMVKLDEQMVAELYQEHVGKPYFSQMVQFMTQDVVLGLEVVGQNAIQSMIDLAGPTNPRLAKQQYPHSWRARYGSEGVKNAVHVS